MAYITSDIDELLKEHNLELTLFEKMEPELNMLGMFEKKDNNGKDTFAFARDETTAEKMILDGIMKEPVELLEGAELPEVQITGINKNVGKMRRIGFQAVFTEEAIKDNINYDKIKKTVEAMAYAIARTMNRHAYQILIQAGAAPTIVLGDGEWDNENEEIDNDIKKLKRAFKAQEGYDYNLTNAFVSQDSFWAMEDFYDAILANGFNAQNVRGIAFKDIKELDSGLLGLDMTEAPAKWYYNVYPEDNQLHDKYGTFIHINRVDELEGHKMPRKVTIQMYVEYGFAVLEPKAVVFQEGI